MASRSSKNKESNRTVPEGGDPVQSPEIIKSLDEDPYRHIGDLGDGAYGVVDKVERGGIIFARKKIRISTGRDREKTLRAAQQEFAILNRLKHRHIIEVVEIFQCKNRFRIIMAQVADTDLTDYMERVDYSKLEQNGIP